MKQIINTFDICYVESYLKANTKPNHQKSSERFAFIYQKR